MAAYDAKRPHRNFQQTLDADLVTYHVAGGERLPPVEDLQFDGVVVTGSPASVYEDDDWIQRSKTWVSKAIQADIPHLGVCFGHQLLAEVLGGTVEPLGEYELGYRTVHHRGDRLFTGLNRSFTVFTSHSDTVRKLPPNAARIAVNEYGVHGFRKDHTFGIQFHPEYDQETAASIARRKDLSPSRLKEVMASFTRRNVREAREATNVLDNFLAYVQEVRLTESKRLQSDSTNQPAVGK